MKKQLTTGRIATYLLYLAVACSVVFGVTYARYISRLEGGTAADVAAVAMDGKITTQTVDISSLAPGVSKTLDFQVVNFTDSKVSEVAQKYSVTVKTAGNLPLVFTLQPAVEGTDNLAGNLKNTDGNWVSEQKGKLPAAAETTHSYRLTILWPDAADTSNPDVANPAYADEIDTVTLIIQAEQALS